MAGVLNDEFPSKQLQELPPTKGPTLEISLAVIKDVIRKIKNRIAVGPDETPVKIWKKTGNIHIWLHKL